MRHGLVGRLVEWMAKGNKVFEIVTDYLHIKFVSRFCGAAQEWPEGTYTKAALDTSRHYRVHRYGRKKEERGAV